MQTTILHKQVKASVQHPKTKERQSQRNKPQKQYQFNSSDTKTELMYV